jgi:hypothetical protein
MDQDVALRAFLRQLVEQYLDPDPEKMAPRWQGGMLTLQPGNDSMAKQWPIEQFFKKVTSIRDNLRVLEQKINTNDKLLDEDKIALQGYITKCYGSLTSFNVLFHQEGDRFVGQAGKGESQNHAEPSSSRMTLRKKDTMTLAQAKRKLGLAEHGED